MVFRDLREERHYVLVEAFGPRSLLLFSAAVEIGGDWRELSHFVADGANATFALP